MVQRPRPDLRGGCAAMRIPTVTGVKRRWQPRSGARFASSMTRNYAGSPVRTNLHPTLFGTPLPRGARGRVPALGTRIVPL